MVFNPTSPIRSFQVKQKAAEIARPAIQEKKAVQSKQMAMTSFEQTPAAVALAENKVEMKSEHATEAQKDPIEPEIPETPEVKPAGASPTISFGFSETETVKADRNSNVSNLSNRPRQSWAGSMKRLIGRSASVLQSENKLSKQQPSKAPLKISDPIAIPAPIKPKKVTSPIELATNDRKISKSTTNSSPVDPSYDPVKKGFRSSKDEKVEPSPVAITKPDEPRSFLDLDSSSDEELPVIQRASSVRVGRPHIVRHTSNSAKQAPHHAEKNGTDSPSLDKAERLLGEPIVNLYNLNPADETLEEPAVDAHADALAKLEGKADSSIKEIDQHGSTIALPPTPPILHDEDIKSTTIVVSDHPDNSQPHNVYFSPRGDLRSVRASIVTADTVPELPTKTALDGLRSNPISDQEISLLSRTISAPALPNRNPNRHVTIRPADLVIHHADHDHKLFRETIVTTPYPPHLNSPTAEKKGEEFKTPSSTLPPEPAVSILPSLPLTSKTDRFSSPTSADEHLFLTLSLSCHPSASTTIEIIIPSASATTYDDQALFTAIRSAYNTHLLGGTRRFFSSRTLSHAMPGTSDMHLDSFDFIAHLSNPVLGLKRKGWLIWLRNQQPVPKRASSLFSSATSPVDSALHQPHSAGHHSTASGGNNNYWSPSSVPRMPFMKSPSHAFPPQLVLHYRFALLSIFVAAFFILLLSVLSTILWVLFGYPGQHAGAAPLGATLGPTVNASGHWQTDAQLRVLTGLVLGMSVMAFGGCGVGGVGCRGVGLALRS